MNIVKECPIGSINMYTGKGAIPYGWLACDGLQMDEAAFIEKMKKSHQITFGEGASAEHEDQLIQSFQALCRELVYVNERIIIPDLQSHFIVGAGLTADAKYKLRDSGGKEQVQLSDSQIPIHTHKGKMEGGPHKHFQGSGMVYTRAGNFNAAPRGYVYAPNLGRPVLWEGGEHTHSFQTNVTGETEAHSNMPPYYTVQFIIRVLL